MGFFDWLKGKKKGQEQEEKAESTLVEEKAVSETVEESAEELKEAESREAEKVVEVSAERQNVINEVQMEKQIKNYIDDEIKKENEGFFEKDRKENKEEKRLEEISLETEAAQKTEERTQAEVQEAEEEKAQVEVQEAEEERAQEEVQEAEEEETQEKVQEVEEEKAQAEVQEATKENIQEEVQETAEEKVQEEVQEIAEEKTQAKVQESEEEKVLAEVQQIAEEKTQEEVQEPVEEKPQKEKKMGFFKRLVAGLTKTRNNIVSGIDSILKGFSKIDEDFYEELEEILIMGDLGVNTTMAIIEDLKEKVKEQKIKEPSACKELLIESIKEQMSVGETAYEFENRKSVILLIGVNGVGKTTTIGKLSGQFKKQGKKVMVAAADTFRAAAIDQLAEWAKRANVDIIAQQEGSDPAAVVYDAVAAAKARNTDILLCDTAGRLHNKKNLMEELRKINKVIDREYPDAYKETLVVLDGTTGQNALAQAKQFNEVAEITGIVLTKLDGTAKGGIAIAIQSELGIPVKYIGIGEKIEDLQKFNSEEFVNALFDMSE